MREGLAPTTFILISAERTRTQNRLLIISFGKRSDRLQVKCSDPIQTLKGCGHLNLRKKGCMMSQDDFRLSEPFTRVVMRSASIRHARNDLVVHELQTSEKKDDSSEIFNP